MKIFRGANHLANLKGSSYQQQSASGIGIQSCRVGCHVSSRTYDRAHLLAVRGQTGGDTTSEVTETISRSLPAHLGLSDPPSGPENYTSLSAWYVGP